MGVPVSPLALLRRLVMRIEKFQFELPSRRLLPKLVVPKLWKIPRCVLPQINMPRILIDFPEEVIVLSSGPSSPTFCRIPQDVIKKALPMRRASRQAEKHPEGT